MSQAVSERPGVGISVSPGPACIAIGHANLDRFFAGRQVDVGCRDAPGIRATVGQDRPGRIAISVELAFRLNRTVAPVDGPRCGFRPDRDHERPGFNGSSKPVPPSMPSSGTLIDRWVSLISTAFLVGPGRAGPPPRLAGPTRLTPAPPPDPGPRKTTPATCCSMSVACRVSTSAGSGGAGEPRPTAGVRAREPASVYLPAPPR